MAEGQEPSEEQKLIKKAQQGGEEGAEAMNELLEIYQHIVYQSVFFRVRDIENANDITQKSMIKAWRKIGQFRGESQFKTWITRIAINMVNSHNKAENTKRARTVSIEDLQNKDGSEKTLDDFASKTPNQRRTLEAREKLEQIRMLAISHLSPNELDTYLLKYFEGASYKEIAETLEMKLNTVRTTLRRATEKMSKLLRDR